MNRKDILKQIYGYDSFRPGQEQVISALEENRDVLCIMPTGGGKSLCYQIPALEKQGVTLIISPLLSLMSDQVQALRQKGVRAAYLNSSLSLNQLIKAEQNMRRGLYQIVYVAPERLENEHFLETCASIPISMVIVDEAHCISQWGMDFRKAYQGISGFVDQLPNRPVVGAFTATADQRVQQDVQNQLKLQNPLFYCGGYDRPNLYFEVRSMSEGEKENFICRYIRRHRDASGIIYCSTVAQVEELYESLKDRGFSVGKYHGRMDPKERNQMQDDFVYDNTLIMVATNAFGMGIDKPNVSYVIHHNMPASIENYYQEAGRAGRDGEPGECILLYSGKDYQIQKFFIDQRETTTEEEVQSVRLARIRLQEMMKYVNSTTCLRRVILNYFGETREEDCQNCSVCKTEYIREDITREAQILLSTIKRVRERYGISMICDIVKGSRSAKLLSRNLNEISTYGLMKDESAEEIRDMANYLLAEGYIRKDKDQYAVVHLEQKGIRTLLGEKVMMPKKAADKKQKLSQAASAESDQATTDLQTILRVRRLNLARQRHLPPYMVFNDATLMQIASRKPSNEEELLEIPGVGQAVLKNYGEIILSTIRDYQDGKISAKKPVGSHEIEQKQRAAEENSPANADLSESDAENEQNNQKMSDQTSSKSQKDQEDQEDREDQFSGWNQVQARTAAPVSMIDEESLFSERKNVQAINGHDQKEKTSKSARFSSLFDQTAGTEFRNRKAAPERRGKVIESVFVEDDD